MKLPREELIQRLRIGLEARRKKKIDFLDDDHPLLRPDERGFSKRPRREVLKVRKLTGFSEPVKYIGNKKLGSLRMGVNRSFTGPNSTQLTADVAIGGKKYFANFSEQKFSDANDLANEFLRQALKEQHGDNVKILSDKAFLKIMKDYKGTNLADLSDELNMLNYVSKETYKKVGDVTAKLDKTDAQSILRGYIRRLSKNRSVKAFKEANPKVRTGDTKISDKNFSSNALSLRLNVLLNSYFRSKNPKEAVKVDALIEQKNIFNKDRFAAKNSNFLKLKKNF